MDKRGLDGSPLSYFGEKILSTMLKFSEIPIETKTTVLGKIHEELQSAPVLQALLENVNLLIQEEFECSEILVSIFDFYRDELVYYSPGSEPVLTEFKLKVGEGLAGVVAASHLSRRVESLQEYGPSRTIFQAFGVTSEHVLASPLIRRGEVLGVVEVFFSEQSTRFTEAELRYLRVISYQIATGLNYFRLREQTERISLEEKKLAEVSEKISASLELDELLDLIIDSLRALIPYDAAGIYLLERSTKDIQRMVVYGYDQTVEQDELMQAGREALQVVIKTEKAVILKEGRQSQEPTSLERKLNSAMVAPIFSNKRMIGVFTLESREPDVYTAYDLELFEKFTNQVAISIEKARLHRELLSKKRLEQEISIAREIQKSFLPAQNPQIKGFEVAGLNLPSRLVSGDHYDFIKIVEGQWGLVVGDVSGKGIPSALIMASFRASLLAEIRNNYSIRTIMAKVNQLLWESTDSNQFVTAFYGVLDEKRRILTFCNAGHTPGLLIHADGSSTQLETGGLILGAFADASYWEGYVQIQPNEILLLYTDGVTEIYDKNEEEFGVERLLELASTHRSLSAQEITLLVKEKILEFAADGTIQDDFTLLVLKSTV